LENIFISTDWHLYSDEANVHHPYRTMLDLTLLKNNVGRDMSPADLWLFLGDLCDPKVANRETIRRILETIPARKVLVRGNHDTEDDQWYLDLGFDQVTDGVVIHNMLFTHRPEPVPKDWINIHGHIHFEKIAMDGTHINAYATNWNDTCHPVLLDDLLHGARVQKIDVSNFKEEKYRKYFERNLENDPTRTRLDLTDEFKLYPVDESAGSVQTMHEILEFNRELGDWDYGIWNGTKLIKNPKDADYANYITMKRDQFARTKGGTCWDYVPYEISEFAKRWPRVQRHAWNIYFEDEKSSPSHAFITFQVGRGGWMLFEASDKTHRGIWCGGSEDDIVSQCFLWLAEVNNVDIKKTKAWATRYAPLESKWFGIEPQTYMDQLTKTVDEWKIDPTVELIPYGESVNEDSSLIESILFPDVDTTKYFEADDNEYKKKAAKAEVDQKADSVVTLDESADANSIEKIAKDISQESKRYAKNGEAGNQNCLFCAFAFEMQCRGKNVMPRPVYSPRDPIFDHADETIVNGKKQRFNSLDELKKIVNNDDSRYYVHVNWKDSTGGHEFNLVNRNGKVFLVDAQNGIVADIDSKTAKNYFNINYANSYVVRTDNAPINQTILKLNSRTDIVKWDHDADITYMKAHNMIDSMTESSHIINVPTDLKTLDESLQARAPRILYHGSNTLITGELLPMDSGATGVHLFATDSYAFALAFSGKQWNDLELNQSSVDGVMYLTEILPGKLQEKYGDGGFVYELPGAGFTRFQDSKHEFITDLPVKPIKVHRVFKTIDEMRKAGVRIYEYPDLPPFIKSRKDYILKKCKEHHLKPSIELKRMMNVQGESDRSKSMKLNEFANMMVDALNERQVSAKDFFGKTTTNGKDRLVLYPMATARPGPRTIMASNILDNYRMVNPLELDSAELIKVETPEDLLEYFKKKARVYYDNPKAEKTYNAAFPGYVTCMRVLIRMMAMTGDPDLVTIDDVAGMIPTDMPDDKFKSWIKSVIDEVEDFRGFVENILLSNLDAIGDSELRGRVLTATTTKSDRLKALAKIVEKRVLRNGSPVIHGKTAVYDFRSIARAIVYRNLDTFTDDKINLVNYLKRAADYDYVVISHGHMVDGEWCILPITIDGRDYTKVDELLDVLCKTDDTKVLLMCCNPGAKAPTKNRPGVDYVLTNTLLESAIPARKSSIVEEYITFLDEELAAVAAAKAACTKIVWSYEPYLSPKNLEYLDFDFNSRNPSLVKRKDHIGDLKPKKVVQAYRNLVDISFGRYFRYLYAARSLMKLILRYRDGKMNEVGHYWTNIGTFTPAALDEGFAFMNIPTLRFDGYAECLEDAAAYVAYLNIGKDRPQDILDRQLIGYSEPTSMGEAYEIVGSEEVMNVVVLGEAADYATYDKNHKQQGHLNLSDLKLVKIDKEYLKKHGKKGALKDAAVCGKYCTSVAWELDGKPVVSIAVGYPNPAEREPGDNYNWIGNLLVDPEYRSHGLGKQAMEYAIKELGGDALAVRSSNEVAISMYKKRGFKTSKDSARAVANKHANYYQMYLHEDIGIDVGTDLNEAIAETDSIDRQEKERIANQYELRDVGNTHMQEDKIYADIEEYKRQNALKKKQRAKEQEHDRRMKYLKKANRVRKRKRILRKIKRAILPGVKNEDAGSVDNTDTESRELADIRQEETFGGDRRRYFESKVQYANASEADNGPTIIESSVKIQFRKPVLESADGGNGSTKVIDVAFFSVDGVVQQIGILGKPDTRILTVQRTGSGDSSRISLVVGTDIDPKLYSRGKPSYDLFIVFGEDGFNILGEVKRRFDAYASKHAVFSLDGSADAMTTAEFCELLIRYLSGIEPNDTLDVQLAHHSNTMEIDKVAVSKKVELLIAEKNLQQKLQEGANIDLHPDNPWQDLILEYQLGFDGDYNS